MVLVRVLITVYDVIEKRKLDIKEVATWLIL